MPKKPYHAKLADLPKKVEVEVEGWPDFDGTWQRTAVVGDASLLQAGWYEPGFGPDDFHSHPFDQMSVTMSGRMELVLDVDGEHQRYEAGPGDVLYIPANVPHRPRVLGDETCFLLDIFAPVREDYLDMVQHQLERED
jgi:mannose-6-phosphate isomerase-like protein (cupin superfamily)